MQTKQEANSLYVESLELDYREVKSKYYEVSNDNINLKDKVKRKNNFIYGATILGFIGGILISK